MRPTTSAPAVSTSRVNSSRCSSTCRESGEPLRGAATSTTRSVGSRTGISGLIGGPSLFELLAGAGNGDVTAGASERGPSLMSEGDDFTESAWQLERCLSFHLVRQLAVIQRSPDRAAHSRPVEAERQCQCRLTVLLNRKIVVIADITQM